jgi:hypothetical protein
MSKKQDQRYFTLIPLISADSFAQGYLLLITPSLLGNQVLQCCYFCKKQDAQEWTLSLRII